MTQGPLSADSRPSHSVVDWQVSPKAVIYNKQQYKFKYYFGIKIIKEED
jgi:hypothetical protein